MREGTDEREKPCGEVRKKERKGTITSGTTYEKRRDVGIQIGERETKWSIRKGNGVK